MSDASKNPTSARDGYWYARLVIKGRWPEAESVIRKNPYYAYCYARYVIQDRWPEAEEVIAKNSEWHRGYQKFLASLGATR
jgi:hypothetical protein